MRIPISWLKDYVDIDEPVAALAERLTLSGLEGEAVHRIGEWWDPATLLVGRVAAVRPHPAADRLAPVEVGAGEAGVGGRGGGVGLEIALAPALARCRSVIGVARGVAALPGAALRLRAAAAALALPAIDEAGRADAIDGADATGGAGEIEVEIADPGGCNRY